MIDIKLKECPFCGCEDMTIAERPRRTNKLYVVYCNNCEAESGEWDSEEKAIDWWNTRKPMDRIVEQLEAEQKFYDKASETFIHSTNHISSNAFQKAIEIVKAGGVDG